MIHKLTFRAPRRAPEPTRLDEAGRQLWSSDEWTVETVILARRGGAWFSDAGEHDFASREAAQVAHQELVP